MTRWALIARRPIVLAVRFSHQGQPGNLRFALGATPPGNPAENLMPNHSCPPQLAVTETPRMRPKSTPSQSERTANTSECEGKPKCSARNWFLTRTTDTPPLLPASGSMPPANCSGVCVMVETPQKHAHEQRQRELCSHRGDP